MPRSFNFFNPRWPRLVSFRWSCHPRLHLANLRLRMSAPITTTTRESQIPLCVDMDCTLIKTDMLWESLVRLLRRNPLWLVLVPFWWLRGRAVLKQQIAARVNVDVAALPYHGLFLEFLRDAKRQGRRLILASASDHDLANAVAKHVGLFDEVLASDGRRN